MLQATFNRQIRLGRNWMKARTTNGFTNNSANAKTISELRIMSTRATSLNMHTIHSTTATLLPQFASQNEYIRGDGTHSNSAWMMAAAMSAIFGAAYLNIHKHPKSNTECCGIAGVVGSSKNHDARYVLFEYSVYCNIFISLFPD